MLRVKSILKYLQEPYSYEMNISVIPVGDKVTDAFNRVWFVGHISNGKER